MAGEITTTAVGNLTEDPELRFTPSGAAVVAFTIAVNSQRFDKEQGKYVDAGVSYVRCQAWRQLAENVAESLTKGMRVIVSGRFAEEHWTDKETQQPRSAWRLTADAAGPDLTWATATVRKAARRGQDGPPDDEWASATRERPADATAGAS